MSLFVSRELKASRHPRLGVAVALLAALSLPGSSIVEAQGMPAARVQTAPVESLVFHRQLTLVGRTEARSESEIVALISGRVERIDANEGRPVKRGAPLVTIDCRRLSLSHEAKIAEAAQAKAQAVLAAKELERAEELVSTSVLPVRNLDQAAAEAERATARHQQLDAERRQLEIDVGNCTIRAPYAGHTIRQRVDVGEWVDPGVPVYDLVSLDRMEVRVDLPERRFGELEMGSPVEIEVSGAEDTPITGEVVGIAPRASETTHTFPVVVEVDNRDGRLGSGMLVRATLTLAGTFESLAVSKDAIVRQGDSTLVYAVVDGKAVPLTVTLGARSGSHVAVSGEGLTTDTAVVIRGNERLFPGSEVIVEGAGNPPGGSGTGGEEGS